jgi:UDP-N-acetylmuramoyl-tripeptide--D-alanyl-D-alanine ligase
LKRVHLNIEDVFNIPDSVIYEPDNFRTIYFVTIDSREVKKNTLFVAIKGNRFDGHDFVKDAVRKGAVAVVINKKYLNRFDEINVPLIAVNNTKLALGNIAGIWRKKLNTKIIGITGSTGKTTVKDMLAELLKEKYSVNKTFANNNNDIGVPLTILNTNEKHQVLVAELGTNHFGEIPYTAKILSPDFALITNVGNSHLEFLKTKNSVWKEKSFLFDETIRNNGKVFLNYDDPIIKEKHSAKGKQITFGFSGRVDVRGKIKSYTNDGGPIIEIKYNKKSYDITSPLYGEQSAENLLASTTVAVELGLSLKDIRNAMSRLKAPSGRLDVQRYKNFILIDDTYNANPDSTKAAIELVGRIKSFRRKILFLGDMLELGDKSIQFHKSLKSVIEKNRIDEVYTIGPKMKYLHQLLKDDKIIAKHLTKRKMLLSLIKKINLDDSVILVKGSRGMKMEEFLSEIKTKSLR